ALDPLAEFGRGESLSGLRRAVLKDADHDDRVSMHVQTQLDRLILFARDLIRANFGGIELLFVHNVGGCSASALARQLLTHVISPHPMGRGWYRSRGIG